jgi:mitochondrial fission protein ELM1
LDQLYENGAKRNDLFLVTSSRRTPQWADQMLKEVFLGKTACPMLVIANEMNRNAVVPGILGACDTIIVTGESMSMVTEAVTSKKHVIVMNPFDRTSLKSKHREFLGRLEKAKLVTWLDDFSENSMTTRNGINSEADAILEKDRGVLQEAVRKVA